MVGIQTGFHLPRKPLGWAEIGQCNVERTRSVRRGHVFVQGPEFWGPHLRHTGVTASPSGAPRAVRRFLFLCGSFGVLDGEYEVMIHERLYTNTGDAGGNARRAGSLACGGAVLMGFSTVNIWPGTVSVYLFLHQSHHITSFTTILSLPTSIFIVVSGGRRSLFRHGGRVSGRGSYFRM